MPLPTIPRTKSIRTASTCWSLISPACIYATFSLPSLASSRSVTRQRSSPCGSSLNLQPGQNRTHARISSNSPKCARNERLGVELVEFEIASDRALIHTKRSATIGQVLWLLLRHRKSRKATRELWSDIVDSCYKVSGFIGSAGMDTSRAADFHRRQFDGRRGKEST